MRACWEDFVRIWSAAHLPVVEEELVADVYVTLGEHADASHGVAEQGLRIAIDGRVYLRIVDEAEFVAGVCSVDVLV